MPGFSRREVEIGIKLENCFKFSTAQGGAICKTIAEREKFVRCNLILFGERFFEGVLKTLDRLVVIGIFVLFHAVLN